MVARAVLGVAARVQPRLLARRLPRRRRLRGGAARAHAPRAGRLRAGRVGARRARAGAARAPQQDAGRAHQGHRRPQDRRYVLTAPPRRTLLPVYDSAMSGTYKN